MENLPSELAARIFGHLNFDEISRVRLKIERYHAVLSQRVKAQLPRRESERRTHELSRHSDILGAIETRLSLLTMTFNKYIESGVCCFIPGKVLDEMFRLLRLVNKSFSEIHDTSKPNVQELPRPHELLQELRDISSMAMEYFDEVLVHDFRDIFANRMHLVTFSNTLNLLSDSTPADRQVDYGIHSNDKSDANDVSTVSLVKCVNATSSNPSISKENVICYTNRTISYLQRKLTNQSLELKSCKEQIKLMNNRFCEQAKKLVQQNKLIKGQSMLLVDVNKRLLELGNKFADFETHATKEKGAAMKRMFDQQDEESSGTPITRFPSKRWKK